MYRTRAFALAITCLAAVAACSGGTSAAEPATGPPTGTSSSSTTTATTTTTAPSDEDADQSTGDSTDGTWNSPDDDAIPDRTITRTPADDGPEVLSPESSGRELGMSEVFGATGDWDEDRFSGAGQADVRGLGISLTGCRSAYEESSYSSNGTAGQLELRLARKFTELTFEAFETDDSPSSDETLVVEVLAGGDQADIRRVTFDQLQEFEVPVTGQNAVKVRVYLESRDGCTSNTEASVAITGLTVT